MIPKIVHYCWFGQNPLPETVKQCIATWKSFLPDFEIIEWNENNFKISDFQFADEAYKAKKYAFVSDVARLYALQKMGGIYLDTDVEFIKPLPENFLNSNAFIGFEDNLLLSSALIAATKNSPWINDILNHYNNRSFHLPNGQLDINPNTEIITKMMANTKGLKINNSFQSFENYCDVYPSDYFSPKSWKTLKTNLTNNTICIHHFSASWIEKEPSFLGKLSQLILGKRRANALSGFLRNLKS